MTLTTEGGENLQPRAAGEHQVEDDHVEWLGDRLKNPSSPVAETSTWMVPP